MLPETPQRIISPRLFRKPRRNPAGIPTACTSCRCAVRALRLVRFLSLVQADYCGASRVPGVTAPSHSVGTARFIPQSLQQLRIFTPSWCAVRCSIPLALRWVLKADTMPPREVLCVCFCAVSIFRCLAVSCVPVVVQYGHHRVRRSPLRYACGSARVRPHAFRRPVPISRRCHGAPAGCCAIHMASRTHDVRASKDK
ncbi:hypothetical protein HYPSUDRAFT_275188 [Hypholoma sublateritium FD-334 SS-4]|uniref:Uncharacterized protein n=1 Tax=Hypholoma sublateritium (strain FD-334 SS-4) TaxID=945553 RepID=A0A0D2PCY8_HYPSF|nr:hypothetical protein HYPSUDRAFT_275188 [Hypholoma sublateritium FD-334 SS-4]